MTGFVLGLVLIVALAGAALFAADASYEGRILPGVRVGSTDLSGMDRGQAAAALKSAYAGYGAGRLIVRTTAGDVTVPYADIARQAHVDEMVDAALATGRDGTALERAVGEVRLATGGRTVEPWLTIDEAALKAKVEAGLAGLARPPVDSTIVMGPKTITLTPAQTGRTFDGTAAVAAAIAALGRTERRTSWSSRRTRVTTQPAVGLGTRSRPSTPRSGWRAAHRHPRQRQVDHQGGRRPVLDPFRDPGGRVALAGGGRDRDLEGPDARRQGVKLPAVSASYLKASNGKVVGVTPDKPGHKLDPAAMTAAIAKVVEDRAGWSRAPTSRSGSPPSPPS